MAGLSIVVVRGGNADFLVGLVRSLSRSTLESLMLTLPVSVRVLSVVMRVPRVAVRPIVLPVVLPTVPRLAAFGSRTPAVFSAVLLVALLAPIVLPIRDGISDLVERWFVADCFFVVDIDGSLLPI
jgi:hypothetical protein